MAVYLSPRLHPPLPGENSSQISYDPEHLIEAIQEGNMESVRSFLNREVDLEAIGSCGLSPLQFAASEGKEEIVKLICAKHPDLIDSVTGGGHSHIKEGLSPLHLAVGNGHQNVAAYLIEQGADPKGVDEKNMQPIHYASYQGSVEMVKLLQRQGADLRARGERGWKPVHYAAMGGHQPLLDYLISQNRDFLKEKTRVGFTPLFIAVVNGKLDAVAYLLDCGADVTLLDLNGWSVIHYATIRNNRSIVELLIEKDPDLVNCKGPEGITPLHIAARQNFKEILQYLLEKGGDLQACDSQGANIANYASRTADTSLQVLLQLEELIRNASISG
jgi:ankyrin repeat protein